MAATGCVSESSSTAAEFTTVRRVTSDKYDPFKHLLSWDEKQSLFKWKGSLEELQDFSSNVLELDVSPTKCITDRSGSLKSKLVTLVLYNSTGTLQIQGPESISIKTELENFSNYRTMKTPSCSCQRTKRPCRKCVTATRNFKMSWIY